jgi:hypothetical protein
MPRRLLALLALLPAPALAEAPFTSAVPGLAIAPLDDVPPAPRDQGDRDACLHKLVPAFTTPGGEVAHFQGWGVTAEAAFGPLTAVSFVGGFAQGTSGSCALTDGNVGFFTGDRLQAVLYATDAQETRIGSIAPFGTGGLRLWSGDYLPQPLADILPTPDGGITVQPLAGVEPVCNGTGQVPLIYGQPIDRARGALIAAGWTPVPYAESRGDIGLAPDIAAAGVPEVEECSGTGFGFCAYRYSGPAGELSVTTIGEFGEDGSLPAVAFYGVDCR